MYRIAGGVLILLLALLPARAQDKPEDKPRGKPDTPAEQYKALLQEFQTPEQAMLKAVQAAKTDEDREKAVADRQKHLEKFAARFLELAEKNPKDRVAFDALSWIVTNTQGTNPSQPKALAMLLRDHVAHEKLDTLCQVLSRRFGSGGSLAFLREVQAKSPHKTVQAEASAALAQALSGQAMLARRMKEDRTLVPRLEPSLGKELAQDLLEADVARLQAQVEAAFKEFVDQHASAMKADRLTEMCQSLRFSGGKAAEPLLRTLIDKDTRPEVLGVAVLVLGQMLKARADELATPNPKEAEKLQKESEKLLEQAADKYAGVKLPFRAGTVGAKAKSELYEVRFLAVGKTAPEVEGEDQDGKKFKLSDYRGKVILLDFWSQY
jgi:hypothetical protein